jgi:pimeloyl-ACP methyl ester carboxylesterase
MRNLINANGTDFNVVITGPVGAPWLTFSNSHATDLSLWDAEAERFQDRFRVLRYDTRGHGGTEACRFDDTTVGSALDINFPSPLASPPALVRTSPKLR